jgi:F0F1-type ATP synthase delta subunit
MKKFATGSERLRALAEGLVEISLDGQSLLDISRVHALVIVLKETYEGVELKRILSAYLSALGKFIAATTLRIEHCGEISPHAIAMIKSHFEKLMGRNLFVHTESDDSLIAGIRISVGDMVIEHSIAGTLNAYARQIRSGTIAPF